MGARAAAGECALSFTLVWVNIDPAILQAAVAQETTVEGSVLTLLQQFVDKVNGAANTGDLEAVKAVTAQIQQNITVLTNAVTANTPSAPQA